MPQSNVDKQTPANGSHGQAWREPLGLTAYVAVLAADLFLSAGRLDWRPGWGLVAWFLLVIVVRGVWLADRNRWQRVERQRFSADVKTWDRIILRLYTVCLVLTMSVAGLDAGRFGWSLVPPGLRAVGWIGLLVAGGLLWWVGLKNPFAVGVARIQREHGHRVVADGPYRYVRHPMYTGTILYGLCVPLALGSWWALIPGAAIAGLFLVRTRLEDEMLQRALPGYAQYARRVPWRLLPRIW